MTFPSLADNLFQAAWTILCVTLLHTAVYGFAHKDLRAWIAVNHFLAKCSDGHVVTDDQAAESSGVRRAVQVTGPQDVTNKRNRSTIVQRIRSCVLPVSLVAPILLSIILQLDSADKVYLDATLIVTEFILLTSAVTNVFSLFKTEVAIVPSPMTKHNSHGWSVTDSRGTMGDIRALGFETARKFVPAVSLVLCCAVGLANQAPQSAVYAALLVATMMLGPMCLIRTSRGDDIKMRGWLIFMASALGAIALSVLLFLILAIYSPRDPNLPEEGPDWLDRIFKNKLSIMGNDLIRAIQYALCGFLFSQMVALLRFDHAQSRVFSSEEYENAISDSVEPAFEAEDAREVKSILERSTPRDTSPRLVHIPHYVPAFPAPTFKSSIVGSYLCTVIAILIFPTPESCIVWMLATLVGQTLGGALSVSWNNQWKALWKYEEVWETER